MGVAEAAAGLDWAIFFKNGLLVPSAVAGFVRGVAATGGGLGSLMDGVEIGGA